ncbi:hypothetical protein [Primorskyibacter sp. 2E233]|uniref:hypothetical protein n=1 Tax=Primorskyibacter sp. 2E233 TaxID=3413431 RepID=UPI003BEFDDB1
MTRDFRPTKPAGKPMSDLVLTVWGALADLAQSDLGPALSPRWHIILTGQMAHILIGVALGLYRVPVALVWAVFCGWAAKELFGDIPNGGGAWPVVADSLADLCFGSFGYFAAKTRLEKARNGQD